MTAGEASYIIYNPIDKNNVIKCVLNNFISVIALYCTDVL